MDVEKEKICEALGITVVGVPFWWDRQRGSLLKTITEARPDLSESLTEKELEMKKEKEEEKEEEREVEAIPKEMEVSLSNWRRLKSGTSSFSFLLLLLLLIHPSLHHSFLPFTLLSPTPHYCRHSFVFPILFLPSLAANGNLMLAATWRPSDDPTGTSPSPSPFIADYLSPLLSPPLPFLFPSLSLSFR